MQYLPSIDPISVGISIPSHDRVLLFIHIIEKQKKKESIVRSEKKNPESKNINHKQNAFLFARTRKAKSQNKE